ncbi:unnamed protein product [Darwinula stevensoni]|uniref:Palmitoleoyl-protein carboxylesterase NOTUM n=1 Tax=Darwinula stevensoni TaxID=69355 RepID=A0A7R8WY35_9CRUS|nr:unnamed protein product [Darwinula stevensoni]CAG0878610.1 unnamed protein product [Darwinula stevensoni]
MGLMHLVLFGVFLLVECKARSLSGLEYMLGKQRSLNEVSPSGPIQTDHFLRRVSQALHQCGFSNPSPLQKVLLTNRTVTCNDGSPAGFYIRKSAGSKRWILFLEGGWYCHDDLSCQQRWMENTHLMTSFLWKDTRTEGGILSPYPEENPYWWNANHVYLPYCSSDCWSGRAYPYPGQRFAFLGSLIVEEVIRTLVKNHGLASSALLLLAGSSAGGTGVLVNLDRVSEILRTLAPGVEVRGLADSGWFLDRKPYRPDAKARSPVDAIKVGAYRWKGRVPDRCLNQYPSEPWSCYFGYKIYPTLRTPLFVFQWLYDEAQIEADNVGPPVSKDQWDHIHQSGDMLRNTFNNVSAVFAPACIGHTVLTKQDWGQVKVNGVTLPEALRCWELSPHERNHYHRYPDSPPLSSYSLHLESALMPGRGEESTMQADAPVETTIASTSISTTISPSTSSERVNPLLITNTLHRDLNSSRTKGLSRILETNSTRRKRKRRKRHRKGRRRKRKGRRRGDEEEEEEWKRRMRRRRRRRRERRKMRQRLNKNTLLWSDVSDHERSERSLLDPHVEHRWRHHKDRCNHRLIDSCSWPMCNSQCPPIRDPRTGKEMDFIDLLKSFGLDMGSLADALGIDLHTLNNMDHNVLLRMLTRQN